MNFNFELILFYITLGCGLLAGVDILFFARHRKQEADIPLVFDYARSLFPVFLVVFLLRSFFYEPFRIPSGSLKPTLQVGDFVLVNKFAYGLRLPVIRTKLTKGSPIHHGDIIVFHYPVDPSIYMIKRVIGLPGDRISYIDKTLFVNGQKMSQTFQKSTSDESEDHKYRWGVEQWQENFLGIAHAIFKNPLDTAEDFENRLVPPDSYFVMGDNRDNSDDSRSWGFVPDHNIVGKANVIWLSWNGSGNLAHKIRWDRLGTVIH